MPKLELVRTPLEHFWKSSRTSELSVQAAEVCVYETTQGERIMHDHDLGIDIAPVLIDNREPATITSPFLTF